MTLPLSGFTSSRTKFSFILLHEQQKEKTWKWSLLETQQSSFSVCGLLELCLHRWVNIFSLLSVFCAVDDEPHDQINVRFSVGRSSVTCTTSVFSARVWAVSFRGLLIAVFPGEVCLYFPCMHGIYIWCCVILGSNNLNCFFFH